MGPTVVEAVGAIPISGTIGTGKRVEHMDWMLQLRAFEGLKRVEVAVRRDFEIDNALELEALEKEIKQAAGAELKVSIFLRTTFTRMELNAMRDFFRSNGR